MRAGRSPIGFLLAWSLVLALVPGTAQALEIRDARHMWMDDDTLLVRLVLDMRLPQVLEDALANGVTLEFEAEARIERDRWLGRESVQRETRRVKLQYFALNRYYLVTDVNDDRMELKPTLGDALEYVARRLGRLPMHGVPGAVRERPEDYNMAARLLLVYSALPLPLQLDAGLRGDLTTRREWHRWSLD
ncbi:MULTISPECIES: DUF4390 domain-containing protein [unclassified Thioalkalivibrio]|uniref:DUF4390 domain-containing protein n=1 Tax=unclassified Thioalkalivibrio TaxID=2621013 RepID=UPI00037029BE|nr:MULTISPECIES: DUF4390 domain-containing protein [unclassified Thioalkalivibrio]